MLYSCKYCGQIHPHGHSCHTKPLRRKQSTKQTDIRSTSRWTHKSLEIRKRDNYLCRVCLDNAVVRFATGVHHIVPLENDHTMAYEDDWLLSLCEQDHKKADAGEYSIDYLHKLAIQQVPPLPTTLHRG